MAGIYFLPCSPTLIEWLKKKLGTCYSFIERCDLSDDMISPLICYVAVADRSAVNHHDWKDEFITARKKLLPAMTWLVLHGDANYELEGEDDKFIKVRTPNELETVLVKLFMG